MGGIRKTPKSIHPKSNFVRSTNPIPYSLAFLSSLTLSKHPVNYRIQTTSPSTRFALNYSSKAHNKTGRHPDLTQRRHGSTNMFEGTNVTKDTMNEFAQIYTMVAKLIGSGQMELMTSNRLTEAVAEVVGIYPVPNMAVEHCTSAFMQAAEKATAEGKSADLSRKAAQLAYALAIPPLTGADSIGDFIACVTHGMLLGAIPGSDATRLLYAAQVAHSAFPKRKNLMKMLKKSDKKKSPTSAASTTSATQLQKNTTPPPSPTSKIA
jgi:hypothetical protein